MELNSTAIKPQVQPWINTFLSVSHNIEEVSLTTDGHKAQDYLIPRPTARVQWSCLNRLDLTYFSGPLPLCSKARFVPETGGSSQNRLFLQSEGSEKTPKGSLP